jgi:hypothetical protein
MYDGKKMLQIGARQESNQFEDLCAISSQCRFRLCMIQYERLVTCPGRITMGACIDRSTPRCSSAIPVVQILLEH